MKYHEGECEECKHSRPKPLDSVTFVCFASTGKKWGDCDVVSKNNRAKRKCRFFLKVGVGRVKEENEK